MSSSVIYLQKSGSHGDTFTRKKIPASHYNRQNTFTTIAFYRHKHNSLEKQFPYYIVKTV